MGGGHHDFHIQGNDRNIYESEEEMTSKIRHIELIKHHPQAFHMWPYDLGNIWTILGGAKGAICSAGGAYLGWYYYSLKLAYQPPTYYAKLMIGMSRVVLGLVLGSWVGYMKFGDRQKLHNAWVSERLMRRYPEARDLHVKDLWKMKGVRASHDFYKWC